MPYPVIDSHFHLTDDCFFPGEGLLAEFSREGIETVVVPAYDAVSRARIREIRKRFPEVLVAIGIHPRFPVADTGFLPAMIREIAPVAVGEIGLDFSGGRSGSASQRHLFREQLALAASNDLPVIIHAVRAHDEIVHALREFPGLTGVIHRLSCSRTQLLRYMDLGFFAGIGPEILDPHRRKLRKTVAAIPPERILVETDSPYTRMPGGETAMPGHLRQVVAALARLLQRDEKELGIRIYANTRGLFFGGRA